MDKWVTEVDEMAGRKATGMRQKALGNEVRVRGGL